jgi:AraC-like DNA-binding protein
VRIGLGSDEIGFECKQRLRATVSGHGHAIEDVSTPDSTAGHLPLSAAAIRSSRAHQSRDIAFGVGFENQAQFTTVFGNLVGMTPRQFQDSSDELIGMYRPFLETAQCS